jgi:hypothetical protein
MKSSWILAGFLAASCCPVAAADAPYTNFVVAPDTLTFSPATPLHKGDRLLVQSPRMLVNEVLLLVRCVDHCATRKIIRAWNGRSSGKGPDLLERVTLLEDGDYYFAANEIPLNLRAINFRGCLHSLPLHVLCSDARPLRVTDAKVETQWFRARLSSGDWVWVRATLAAPSALSEPANVTIANAD